MSITVKKEINTFQELREITSSGCDFTLDAIENARKENEFMGFLEEIYFMEGSEACTIGELNNFIQFDNENIFDSIGLNEDGKVVE